MRYIITSKNLLYSREYKTRVQAESKTEAINKFYKNIHPDHQIINISVDHKDSKYGVIYK